MIITSSISPNLPNCWHCFRWGNFTECPVQSFNVWPMTVSVSVFQNSSIDLKGSLYFLFRFHSYHQLSMANGDNSDTSLEDNSEAAMTLAVKSRDILEMTVTKTCLDVFTKLGEVSILAMLQLLQSLIDRIVAWAFCHPRSNLSCSKSGFCKLPEY